MASEVHSAIGLRSVLVSPARPLKWRSLTLSANKVEAAYRRGDLFEKRRQLAEAWAKFCESPAVGGEVVPIRAAQ
jgi:hypothetical protein